MLNIGLLQQNLFNPLSKKKEVFLWKAFALCKKLEVMV